jgi:hypothetical protein
VLPRRYPRGGVRPKTRPGIHVPVTGYRFGTCQLAPRPLPELSSRAPSRAGYALLTKSRYCCRGCIRTPKALGVAPFDLRCCAERLYADHCHVPLSPLAPAYSPRTGSARKLRRFAKALQRLCPDSLSQLARPTRGPDTSDGLQLVLMRRLAHALRHVSQESITHTDPRS